MTRNVDRAGPDGTSTSSSSAAARRRRRKRRRRWRGRAMPQRQRHLRSRGRARWRREGGRERGGQVAGEGAVGGAHLEVEVVVVVAETQTRRSWVSLIKAGPRAPRAPMPFRRQVRDNGGCSPPDYVAASHPGGCATATIPSPLQTRLQEVLRSCCAAQNCNTLRRVPRVVVDRLHRNVRCLQLTRPE